MNGSLLCLWMGLFVMYRWAVLLHSKFSRLLTCANACCASAKGDISTIAEILYENLQLQVSLSWYCRFPYFILHFWICVLGFFKRGYIYNCRDSFRESAIAGIPYLILQTALLYTALLNMRGGLLQRGIYLQLQKETNDFKEPTNRSYRICETR